MIIKQIFSFVALALLTVFILWGLGWLWFATNIALAAPDKITKDYDAIIVLTGGNGRVNKGLDLLADGVAEQLFISGVNEGTSKEDILNSWENRKGRTPCCFILGYKATDTMGNAVEVKDWVTENNIKNALLVTSSYHMVRAQLEISNAVQDIDITPYPVLTDDFEAWKGRFWKLSFSEYNKMIIRWLNLSKVEL